MAKQTFTTGQVLTAAQMTSLQQTAMLGGAASAKTASYTLVAADAGTAISMSNAGATTITVNTGLFAAGDTVHITNLGAGVSTITAGTATVNSSASLALAQYESGFLDFTSTSAAIFVKGAGAAASSGGMTLISEQAVSAVSSVTFGSIAQTYKQLYLVWSGIRHSASGSSFSVRLNNDSSAIYRSNFAAHNSTTWSDQDDNFTHIGSTNWPSFGLNGNSTQVRNDGAGFLILDNYASTTRPKFVYGDYWFIDQNSGTYKYAPYRGIYDTTTAITSIDIFRLSGAGTFTNNNNSSIRLYGLS